MDDTAILFNNIGVHRWQLGYHDAAWILFQGALEVLKDATVALCDDIEKRDECDFCSSNPYIAEANHVLQCDEGIFLSQSVQDTLFDSARSCDAKSTVDEFPYLQIHEDAILVPDSVAKFDLEDEGKSISLDRLNTIASFVLFNLGLVQHMIKEGSEQAISFYNLSLSLEIPKSMWRLKVALLNNLALLYEENDDPTSAQRAMEQVSTIIERSDSNDIADEDCTELCNNAVSVFNKEATAMNVRLILFPPGAASSSA